MDEIRDQQDKQDEMSQLFLNEVQNQELSDEQLMQEL